MNQYHIKLLEFVKEICKNKDDMVSLSNEELKIYKMAFYMYDHKIMELNTIWDYLWDYISKQEMYRRLKLRLKDENSK